MDRKLYGLALVLGLLLAGGCGMAEEQTETESTAVEDPYEKPDLAWISISGTVESVSPNTFTLNYGEGTITVEMDDGDRDADAYKLLEGDKVTVSGRVDDDFMEVRTIEAQSVYVEKLGTYFYASAVDEEDTFLTHYHPIVVSRTVVQGWVTDVGDNEFTVSTGAGILTVELDKIENNLLDDEGYVKIDVGDKVSVTGVMDDDLFEGRVLVADSVVEISSAT